MNLSDKSRKILKLIASGYTYNQIIALHPTYTYKDIFGAAQEAIDLVSSKESISAHDACIQKIKQQYPNAYEPWDEKQENVLIQMFKCGAPIHAIASALKRQPGAISSRIRKLGLPENKD